MGLVTALAIMQVQKLSNGEINIKKMSPHSVACKIAGQWEQTLINMKKRADHTCNKTVKLTPLGRNQKTHQ